MSEEKEDVFNQNLARAREHQKALNKIYRSTIGLVNDIKNQSKKYMEQVADIDGGLEDDPKETEKIIQDNIGELSKNIEQFNSEIGEHCDNFNQEINEMIDHLKSAARAYSSKKGQLSEFLKVRRELLYLEALIRKFKNKILSLQLMNNVLFSFSQEMKHVKDAYKSNLVNVSSEMTEAKELCIEMVDEIEGLD